VKQPAHLLCALLVLANFAGLRPAHAQIPSPNQIDGLDADEANLARWLTPFHRDWLTQDVVYIVTDRERRDFLQLTNDADRDSFIEQFWERRNPDPGSEENTFKAEHYRRIAYANEAFSTADLPGWRSDRGHVYVGWGQPEKIQWSPTGPNGAEDRWAYRYLEWVGADIELRFVDPRHTREYHLVLPPDERKQLFQTLIADNWRETIAIYGPGVPSAGRISQPSPGFKDLEAIAAGHLSRNDFGVAYRLDELPATSGMSVGSIGIWVFGGEIPEQLGNPGRFVGLNFFCRITDSHGNVVETFEKSVPPSTNGPTDSDFARRYSLQKYVPLRTGVYDVAIVVGDPESQKVVATYSELSVSGAPGER